MSLRSSVFSPIRSSKLRCAVPIGGLVLLASQGLASTSYADEKDSCYSSFEESQVLRKKSALLAARKTLIQCARNTCRPEIRRDCLQWLEDVEKQIPSVVFQALTDEGETNDVKVSLDGKVLSEHLDGKAIELDPGPHSFAFEIVGQPMKQQSLTIRQGEQNRSIVVDFRTIKPETAPTVQSGANLDRPIPSSFYVVGALGIIGLASFGTFAILGSSKESDLEKSCKPFCSDSEKDSARNLYRIGDVSLAVGVGSLVAATVIYLVRPERPVAAEKPAPSTSLQPSFGPTVIGMNLSRAF